MANDGHLRALYLAGAAAWPKLNVAEDRFIAHVSRVAGERPAAKEGRLHAADLYLACGCAEGSAGALEAFEERFGLDIDRTLRRHAAESARDELRQMVLARLFAHPGGPKIAAYTGEAPLAYWVRLVALRTAKNLQRHEREVHCSVRPFPCAGEECRFRAHSKYHLERHVNGVHLRLRPSRLHMEVGGVPQW